MYGSGEVGLPFYNTTWYLSYISHTWSMGAIGLPTSVSLASFPLFAFFALLQKVGFPGFIIQTGFFLLILFIAGVSMYLFILELYPKSKTVGLLGALFYILNIFVVFNVWFRFQYTFMFFSSLIPVALFIFYKGIKNKKITSILIFNFVLLIFGMVFAAFTLLELFWIVLGAYLLFYSVTIRKNKKSMLFAWFFYVSTIIVWLLFNSWWILQFIQTTSGSAYVSTQAYSASGDIDTLNVLSANLGNLSYVFRMLHEGFVLNLKYIWGGIYLSKVFIILEYIVPFLAFSPLLLKKKPRFIYFFLSFSLIIIFLMKGSAPPFGEVFLYFFSHIRLLEAFRNPFEKFGLVLPFAYAPLIGFSLFTIGIYIKNKKNNITSQVVLNGLSIILFVVLVFPMWTGWVFSSSSVLTKNVSSSYSVKVPDYYSAAREWLDDNTSSTRAIALPVSGEGITYKWKYGYSGVEISNGLFNTPFLSFCTGVQYLCPIVNNIGPLLINYPADFWKVLGPLNTRYVMVRKDVDIQTRDLQDPSLLENKLTTVPNIRMDKTFGKLTFFSLDHSIKVAEIFPTSNGIYLNSGDDTFISATPLADYQSGDIYFTDPNKENKTLPHSKQIILEAEPIQVQQIQVNRENALYELPYVKYLPGDKLYPFIRLKEWSQNQLAGNNQQGYEWTLFDKRLVEEYQLVQKHDYKRAEQHFSEYSNTLSQYSNNLSFLNSQIYEEDLLRQKYILEEMITDLKNKQQSTSKYESSLALLNNILIKLNVITLYPVDQQNYDSYIINVPQTGDYKIQLDTRRYNDFFTTAIQSVRIDGKEQSVQIKSFSNYTTLLTLNLAKGKHQIDIHKPITQNLALHKNFTITTTSGAKTVEIPLKPFDPYHSYSLTFQYKLDYGNPPQTYIQEIKTNGNKDVIHFMSGFSLEKNKWLTFSDSFIPSQLAKSNSAMINVWGKTCKNLKTQPCQHYINRPTKVEIKNVSIGRKDMGNLYLVSNKALPNPSPPAITFHKINSSRYMVSIKNASSPFFLNFLESFHPLWKAYYLVGNKRIQISDDNHILINSYANSWYIDKNGNYQMEIEFLPEESFILDKWVSGIAIGISLLGLLGYSLIKIRK
jgi:hypothetical protein